MKLNLNRPLCFFDLETTGINITKDRIVEIGILKIFPDGKIKEMSTLVNPEMNIPKDINPQSLFKWLVDGTKEIGKEEIKSKESIDEMITNMNGENSKEVELFFYFKEILKYHKLDKQSIWKGYLQE